MRLVHVDDIKTDAHLAKTIYDSYGRILLKKGTLLTKTYLRKLQRLKIELVYIIDGISEGKDVYDEIADETRLRVFEAAREALLKIESGNPIPNKKVEQAVSKLIDHILQNRDIIVHLNDIRSIQDHTFSHSVNVCILSVMTGLSMGYNELKLKELGMGALLHDIGKAKLLEVVNSESKLTEQCYKQIQKHCDFGYEVLKHSSVGIFAAEVAWQHHERYNGRGYPRGLSGKGILEYARIVAIADVYDALISDRPYRNGMLPYEVFNMIRNSAGIDFDPDIVEQFLSNVPMYPVGTIVRLSNGYKGVIVGVKKFAQERPVVKLLESPDGGSQRLRIIDLGYNDRISITKVERS